MKKILILLSLICSIAVNATTYYVSATGSDAANGLTTGTAWQTLTKVNATTFSAGDQIFFKKGDGWYGTLTIGQSGSIGNVITYGTYGTGATPTITGFTTVTAWTNLGSNIWESTAVSSLSTCNMVAVNGVNTAMGRYPNGNAANSGYLTFQSHSGSTSITSSSLTGTPDWTGAEVVIRPNRWILNRSIISSNSGSTLVFIPATSYAPIDGFGFFIQNDARTLDVQNEWYYNPSTKKIRIYSISQPSDVKVASIADLCTINASNITIDGLAFNGANENAITGNSTLRSNITIKNCSLTLCGQFILSGINCTNFLVHNNYAGNSNDSGISGGTGDGVIITNNTIENVGIYQGMGTLIYAGITTGENENVLIQYNTVRNVGYVGISFYGDNTRIKNNLIDTYCKIIDDGGGIYTYTGARTAMVNDTIKGNIVLNGIGAKDGSSGNMTSTAIGIYLDNNTKNVEVSYNTVANTDTYGMLMNNPSYINIHHNTFYNNTPQIRGTAFTGFAMTNNIVSNNIFFSKTATQGAMSLIATDENLLGFGTINNNTYARPMLPSGDMFWTSQPSAAYVSRSFASWKSYLSQDANSTLLSNTVSSVDDFTFQYNATNTEVTAALPYTCKDLSGYYVGGSVSIPAYSSQILLIDMLDLL